MPIIFPIIFIAVFIWFMTRQVRGAGMQAFSFGQSRARLVSPEDGKSRVTFKDVAGAKEAKEELSEIVDFLKNPKKFFEIGARIPKGVLLMGAPGTGKTLLARAVAGEAEVAFFSISGSEFVEMFVGVGASRVRDLFQVAKKAPPAIIFIDEIDAVGRVRGGGMGGGNDEREQTLNQILVEMDGFEPTEKVVVMSATNRPDVLDPALLRPGRFDRRIIIDLPDRGDREEILKIHARTKPFAEDVNLVLIAERTPGFSGADLYSLMNEAAILAARENRTKVAQFDLVRSIEKVMLGPERLSHLLSKKEKEITAYHEAGHALVASVLPHADPVHKISIISRGRAAGYTLKLPIEDKRLQSKNEFLDDIAMSLGGYVTEKMIFGDITTGPSNDLQVSTAMARDMVTKYGMSERVGPIALEGAGGKALFGRGVDDKEYSEKVGNMIDEEVSKIMNEARTRTEKIITERRSLLDAIATRLIDKETIEKEEFESLLVAHGITPKKKEEAGVKI
jgi:cell division protease FtsH